MTAPVLVEYDATEHADGWCPVVWLNGEKQDAFRDDGGVHAWAMEQAVEHALSIATDYLGRGGVTIRLRVEPATPPALGMESTIAELSAECARLGVSSVSVGRASADSWLSVVRAGPSDAGAGSSSTPGGALLEALRRVALVRAGGGL